MRILLVSLCGLALVSTVCSAQKDEKKSQPKKQAPAAQHVAQPAKSAGGATSAKKATATHQAQSDRHGNSPAAANNAQAGKRNQSATAVNQGHKGKKNESIAGNQGQNGNKAQTSNSANQTQKNKKNQTQVARQSQNANERKAAKAENAGQVKGAKPNQANNAVAQYAAKNKSAKNTPVKPRHFNLAKQPNTAKAPPVKFQQGRRIEGSQNWQGQRYAVFRNYQPQWHDQNWWRGHYGNNIVFAFGAPYYWNAGYWFPAWGYNPNAYYAWDGPIYAYNRMPPDQVTANVQSALQAQGYYRGEVDGLIGPLTRGAIADYQRDHGLYTTSTIDQPTLQSLGIS
jgi:chemotaxis protein histidine kinase CheA